MDKLHPVVPHLLGRGHFYVSKIPPQKIFVIET
jgi:hypothetical protein